MRIIAYYSFQHRLDACDDSVYIDTTCFVPRDQLGGQQQTVNHDKGAAAGVSGGLKTAASEEHSSHGMIVQGLRQLGAVVNARDKGGAKLACDMPV